MCAQSTMLKGRAQHAERGMRRLQVRVWLAAAVAIALLSGCFIASVLMTHRSSEFSDIGKKLIKSQEHQGNWSSCPASWKSFESSCYFVSTEKLSWNDSWKKCCVMGAHLAVINTEEEQNFITHNLTTDLSYFVGLSDPEGQRRWQWVDETPFNKSAVFWHSGEPNNPEERCVEVVLFHGKVWGWNDVRCCSLQRFICEMTYLCRDRPVEVRLC